MRAKSQWTDSIDVKVEPKLLVGWRPARRQLTGQTVDLHEDTYVGLRAVVEGALAALSGMEGIAYGDSVLPVLGEEYMSRRLMELPAKPTPPTRSNSESASTSVEPESSESHPGGESGHDAEGVFVSEEDMQVADVLNLIDNLDDLPVLSAGQLREGTFAFYAICLSQTSGETITCIRGVSPTRVLSKAAFFGRYQGALRTVERPDLLLEDAVDVVITGDEIAILRRSTYDRLFADLDELAAVVPGDVEAIESVLPLIPLAPGSASQLETLCTRLPSMAKRLHKLVARTDLTDLTSEGFQVALANTAKIHRTGSIRMAL